VTHAAIFPGQGAQAVGMGRDVAELSPAAAETFSRADELLGFGLSALCFDGPAERLNATDIQQPAIFTTSVACYRAAVERGVLRDDSFTAMGGLSLGEYTALHLAGALSFEDALRLVHTRGRLMQQAAEQSPGGMVSIMGLDEDAVLGICERLVATGTVRPANLNCPGQIVISGDKAACAAVLPLIEERGGRAIPLDVAGAFHSELMRPAAEQLRVALAACTIQRPRVRVVSNVDAEYRPEPDEIRDALYRQVCSPVRWQACVERLIRDGCTSFVEIGPKRVLAGLLRKIDRKIPVTNIGTAAELEQAAAARGDA